ncbi:hypothetical protein GW746_00325 [Candidatus Saccharibacteria bacterium]|nr:hypothetical protein [Candidatus Saccharibacteria bacterium]NCS82851.1 hypothetical protein [Candidatus Saccharibacteria bacterium]
MKKISPSIPFRRKKKEPVSPSGRITTDTLAEHRERVLAGGRKFKYPVQYAKHKVVINAIVITIAALALLILVGWWQLYPAQNTSDFMYRVTKVLPLPVATVDGNPVRYSDYLMRYKSSIQYLVERDQIDLNSEDGKIQADYVKRRELEGAIADTYAASIAKERGISVTDTELETFLIQQRESSDGEVSESVYNAVILDYYGWSPEEYRHAMKSKLLRQKVAYDMDEKAREVSSRVQKALDGGEKSLNSVASSVNAGVGGGVVYSPAIWVPRDNQDNGLAAAAAKLKKGEVSGALQLVTGNGYYFVRLVDSNTAQVQYEFLRVPLTAFTEKLTELRENNRINEYIEVSGLEGEE